MKKYYIYQYEDRVSFTHKQLITVIFIHQAKVDSQNSLAQEINDFFQQHNLSDKLIILIPEYFEEASYKYFTDSKNITFQRLPGRSENYFQESLLIYKFQNNGALKLCSGKEPKSKSFYKNLFRNGTTQIFQSNGGLVESSSDHHFVFPSGKHCSKFIRTGNVLSKNSEIFFIAVQLLEYCQNKKILYCDTSSINVLPFAVFELFRRFKIEFESPSIHSFESYEIFEATKERFSHEAIVLISSSTSGNIIERLLKENLATRSQIKVIYFIGSDENYTLHSENIICNLTKDDRYFPYGEDTFDTFPGKDKCDLCKSYSRPIYIRSDVFLTIQPKIEKVLISTDCAPKYLSSFIEEYRGKTKENVILKTYFRENNANSDYEIFIDTNKLFTRLSTDNFPQFSSKLTRLIDKYIPANVKYIIHLPDEGSKTLAKLIQSKIPSSINIQLIELIKGFEDQITANTGCAVVVASSIVTGNKLLGISRLMRRHENRLVLL